MGYPTQVWVRVYPGYEKSDPRANPSPPCRYRYGQKYPWVTHAEHYWSCSTTIVCAALNCTHLWHECNNFFTTIYLSIQQMPFSSLLLRNWERPLHMIMESSQLIASYWKQWLPCSNIMAESPWAYGNLQMGVATGTCIWIPFNILYISSFPSRWRPHHISIGFSNNNLPWLTTSYPDSLSRKSSSSCPVPLLYFILDIDTTTGLIDLFCSITDTYQI